LCFESSPLYCFNNSRRIARNHGVGRDILSKGQRFNPSQLKPTLLDHLPSSRHSPRPPSTHPQSSPPAKYTHSLQSSSPCQCESPRPIQGLESRFAAPGREGVWLHRWRRSRR
jgi:hypothetical protein